MKLSKSSVSSAMVSPGLLCATLRLSASLRYPSFSLSALIRSSLLRLSTLLLVCCLALAPAGTTQIPNAKDVVAPTVYVSLEPAARGKSFQIAVVMKIREGFHVNAREKSAEYLIATDLKVDVPAGFQAGDVSYPKGTLQKFNFSPTPLNVYQGTITLRMPVTALATAPLGDQQIPAKLRYQACSTEVCLPPVTLPLVAKLNVVTSSSVSRPAHPEVFSQQ